MNPHINPTREVVAFEAYAVAKGKGVTAEAKVRQHLTNGADVGALLAVQVGRKTIIASMAADGLQRTAHALASGNIRPAVAVVIARWGKGDSIMTVDGKAPYSEWLRLGAVLAQQPQTTPAGKLTSAGKALQAHADLTEAARLIRAQRDAGKMAAQLEHAPAPADATEADATEADATEADATDATEATYTA